MDLHLLTEKLSNALNENYDVTHMDTVISVIAALETSEITKEQLESTRLAKFINELRKKTTSENLARRSKNLLKKWREMICLRPPVDFADSNSNSNFPQLKKKKKKKSPSPSICPVSDDLSLSNSSLSAPTIALNEKTELTFSGRFAATSSQVKIEGDQPPKKRGRKKGSRGVDALITKNSIDQLLKTSKLLSVASGGQKKIKTTQELLADIQGRKCAELPESSTSSVSSESCTPENSNQLLSNGNSPEFPSDFFQTSPKNEIESQLEAIRAQLPPYSASTLYENSPMISCTCFIKEIEENSRQDDTIKAELENENNQIMSSVKSQKSFKTIITKVSTEKREEVKKSIFDFDYEEGNDPLDDILREVKQETIDDNIIEADKLPVTKLPDSLSFNSLNTITKAIGFNHDQIQPQVKRFEIIESENCPAKDFFVFRVGKVLQTQIQSLHNFNIKNVNGNIMENGKRRRKQTDRIVPQYNHISFEWIPKDLSDWKIGFKLRKNGRFNDDIFLGCVNKNQQSNSHSVQTKKNKKKKRMRPPQSHKELRHTPESSPPDLFTDDSSSSFSEFHQVTSSSNSATPNRIVLTIKKTTNKKRSRENKENVFIGKRIKINGILTGMFY
ncbi:MED26.2 family protein [Megaselia abdita]